MPKNKLLNSIQDNILEQSTSMEEYREQFYDMSLGALKQLVKQYVKQKQGGIVGTPFSGMDDFEQYIISEARRGALPKKNQKYFDTFDPNIYYHSTLEDIDKFDPQMDLSRGA